MAIAISHSRCAGIMEISDLLALAEEHYVATFLLVFGIGVLQGSMIARGLRNRFPSLRTHARLISIVLLAMFSINAIFSIAQFSALGQIDLSGVEVSNTLEGAVSLATAVFGIDGGFWSIIAVFVAIVLTLLFRFAQLPRIVRYFILVISAIMLLVALAGRFGVYAPTEFHVTMYALYQAGLVAGVYFVMRRKVRITDDY